MSEYRAEPDLANFPMHLSELEELAATNPRQFAKDPRKITHLLGRVVATVVAYKSQVQQLHRDVQALQLASRQVGQVTTMAPRDAVRYLSAEELADVVTGTHRQVLATANRTNAEANRVKAEADSAHRDAIRELGGIRFAILSVLDDPGIDASTRARLQQALTQFPEQGSNTASPTTTSPAADEQPAPLTASQQAADAIGAPVDSPRVEAAP
jgi:hypothetical protein